MKKFLTLIIGVLFITNVYSQSDYPKIITNDDGQKLVVMTYEQAQKVDNAFELVALLEKAGAECDSLTLSYVKVIDNLEKQIGLFKVDVEIYKKQIKDKDGQIANLLTRLENTEKDEAECQKQIETRNSQITLLEDEVKTLKRKRNIAYGVGIIGVIGGIILTIITQ